jgi:hypothetical protein
MGEPFQVSAVADDVQHALEEVVRQVQQRFRTGARVAVLRLANGSVEAIAEPFAEDDAYKTDWVYRELSEEMAENRRLEESVGP